MDPKARRTAIVTGSGSGMGAAIAKSLAADGWCVAIAARNVDRVRGVSREIIEAGGDALPAPTDVTAETEVQALFRSVQDWGGPPSLLVNCAGVVEEGPVETLSLAQWKKVIDTNLTGAFLCSREAFQYMKPQGRGRIINIGSVSAKRARLHSVPYVTSKFGLDGLTMSMALDGREHGITVSIFHPGFTVTGFGDSPIEVGPRAMDVKDVAKVVVLMASMPDTVNLLEAVALPIEMPFLGRG